MTWALFPGEELFAAPAPAETLRSDDLDSSSMYSKVCRTRIIALEVSGLGFGDVVVDRRRPTAFVGDPVPEMILSAGK